jgi:heme/copper-type cytochrome/quinol oxidase subunit 3
MSAPAIVVPAAESLPRTGVGRNAPGWWGMVLFCATEVALFVYFIASYFYLRGAAIAFAAGGGRHASLALPALMTVLLLSSSFVLRWGEKGIERGDERRLTIALGGTIALGLAFLATQGVEYARSDLMPQTDAYWSVFFTITGVHGAHVAMGLLMLGMNFVRASLGQFTSERRLAVQNVALYWHMVDGIWLVIVATLYLLPRLQ